MIFQILRFAPARLVHTSQAAVSNVNQEHIDGPNESLMKLSFLSLTVEMSKNRTADVDTRRCTSGLVQFLVIGEWNILVHNHHCSTTTTSSEQHTFMALCFLFLGFSDFGSPDDFVNTLCQPEPNTSLPYGFVTKISGFHLPETIGTIMDKMKYDFNCFQNSSSSSLFIL